MMSHSRLSSSRIYNCDPPFLFNPLKHHASFIHEYILLLKEKLLRSEHDLNTDIRHVGNSLMDLYYGELTTAEIVNEVRNYLVQRDSFSLDKYERLIMLESQKYHQVSLSDESNWTLSLANEESRYIHIHPSRNSRFCIRVKSTTLKTATSPQVRHG